MTKSRPIKRYGKGNNQEGGIGSKEGPVPEKRTRLLGSIGGERKGARCDRVPWEKGLLHTQSREKKARGTQATLGGNKKKSNLQRTPKFKKRKGGWGGGGGGGVGGGGGGGGWGGGGGCCWGGVVFGLCGGSGRGLNSHCCFVGFWLALNVALNRQKPRM